MRGSLHRSVAQDIGARILNGEFAPGTLLPNEAEWCTAFGVSRTAVREAIKMLMAKGLILSRPKIGSRGAAAGRSGICSTAMFWPGIAPQQIRSHFLVHMQQVREILEPETAALAATNRTDAQMAEIEGGLCRRCVRRKPSSPGTPPMCSFTRRSCSPPAMNCWCHWAW